VWEIYITNGLLTGVLFLESVSSSWADIDSFFWTFHGGPHAGNFHYEGTTDSITPITEPATMLLLGSGLVGLAAFGRKRFIRRG
jgi:hypothetical protein